MEFFLINSLRSFFTDDLSKNNVEQRGVELTRDNILDITPLFAANNFSIFESYTQKEALMCTGDGSDGYKKDSDFLNDCLFYSLLTAKNKTSIVSIIFILTFFQYSY